MRKPGCAGSLGPTRMPPTPFPPIRRPPPRVVTASPAGCLRPWRILAILKRWSPSSLTPPALEPCVKVDPVRKGDVARREKRRLVPKHGLRQSARRQAGPKIKLWWLASPQEFGIRRPRRFGAARAASAEEARYRILGSVVPAVDRPCKAEFASLPPARALTLPARSQQRSRSVAPPSPIFDHIVIDVRDRIDEAAQRFAQLGF
jgi:hypothetical protein